MTAATWPPRRVRTRQGLNAILRPARPGDASQMLENLRSVVDEGVYLAIEEPPTDAAEEARAIARMQTRSLILVAEVSGRVVGDCWLVRGKLRKTSHSCSLGIHVIKEYRAKGLARVMIAYGIDWARWSGLEKIYQSVFDTNERAIGLYRDMGFIEEGRRSRQYKLDGLPVAEILMGMFL